MSFILSLQSVPYFSKVFIFMLVHISGFPRTEFEVLRYLFSDPWRKYKAAFNDNGTAMVDLQLSLNRIISLVFYFLLQSALDISNADISK